MTFSLLSKSIEKCEAVFSAFLPETIEIGEIWNHKKGLDIFSTKLDFQAVVLLLLFYCFQLFVGVLCLVIILFLSSLSLSSFAIILMKKRELEYLL